MGNWSKKQYRELLEDISCEYCNQEYCILKEFLVESHPSPRLLVQMKCVEKFKFERNKDSEEDMGWSEAMTLWAEEGYAKKFAKHYEEGVTFRKIYKQVMEDSD
jgi:hypothetical protein